MLKQHRLFCFNCLILLFLLSCQTQDYESDLTFGIIDVGQGLSQILLVNSDALLFDMGPPQSVQQWHDVYRNIGKPNFQAIIISHRDLDHSGGLLFLDSTVNWNGLIVTSKHEDTAYIKGLCKSWGKGITVVPICEGETLEFMPEVKIQCLWPPANITDLSPVQDLSVNRYSLVFQITYQNTSILITSDIDSIAAFKIANSYKQKLHCNIMVVPHHGSIGSLNRVFLGYIQPEFAVISCAQDNQYNHPSGVVVSFFRTAGSQIRMTYIDKSVFFCSNGFYWMNNK